MKCPHCNQEHPDDYKFCPVTGKEIETLLACQNSKCPNHGKHVIPVGSQFCPICGQSIDANSESLDSLLSQPIDIPESMYFGFDEVVKFGLIFVKGSQSLSDFYICDTQITQGLWKSITGYNLIPDSHAGRGVNKPVFNVSVKDAEYFIEKLNKGFLKALKERLILKEYIIKQFALPTEKQWEYAARGGINKEGYNYCGSDNIDEVAWYNGNSNSQVHEVKMKKPNVLKIYDMCGNVSELCVDYSDYVAKGGNWGNSENGCLINSRICISSNKFSSATIGFRVVLELERR